MTLRRPPQELPVLLFVRIGLYMVRSRWVKARAKLLTSRCRLGEAYRLVGNNSLKAPLNASARGEHSSASTENSDGIDPNYCCGGAVVRWRRILGSASRPLVKLTMIDNHSRSYDVTRHRAVGDMTARSRHRSSSTKMRWRDPTESSAR